MARSGPELVIGIASPMGMSNRPTVAALQKALGAVDYTTEEVHAIDLVYGLSNEAPPTGPRHQVYHSRMSAGNAFRRQLERNDAIALASIADIRRLRRAADPSGKGPVARRAYVIRSLKKPEEVQALRRVYGSSFVLIAAYMSRERRLESLADWLAKDPGVPSGIDRTAVKSEAEKLISRDEHEQADPRGQNLGATFPLADVFIDAEAPDAELQRFVELEFGHPFRTPSRDEMAMFLAFGAALRSASPARQVGAAIATADGEIVALGTNEVAKAFGGQYWEGDEPDHRDHTRPHDVQQSLTTEVLRDLLARLRKKEWLSESKSELDLDALVTAAEAELLRACSDSIHDPLSLHGKASLLSLIEFMRPVHAEMAAISSAARLGIAIQGCTLYSTTFPCHECARHIVAAGIRRVVFVEPYPKSRVPVMFDDSVGVDSSDDGRVPFVPFVGVSPSIYMQVFGDRSRRTEDGSLVRWEEVRRSQQPRRARKDYGYLDSEAEMVDLLSQLLAAKSPGGGTEGGNRERKI